MSDLFLINANVLTMDPARPQAGAVAITGGRIETVAASPAELSASGLRADRVIDLRGATVTPRFHDAHNHMLSFGRSLTEVDLSSPPIGSRNELYAAIARRAEDTGPQDWVVGSGYDQNKIGGHPDRDALGRVATYPDGRPSGLLEEQAQALVKSLVYPFPLAMLTGAVDRAGTRYLAEGITSCTEAGIGGGWIGHSPVELAAYQAARDQGRLHVLIGLMVASDVLHPLGAHPDDGLERGLDLGIRTASVTTGSGSGP